MSTQLEINRSLGNDFSTVGLTRDRIEKLKEIKEEHGLRSLNAAVAVAISAHDQLYGLDFIGHEHTE